MRSNKNQEERTPLGQRFYDNIWLLLVLGIVIPTLFYTLWGLWELFSTPKP